MTDQQWYDKLARNYEQVAAGLLANGYQRQQRPDIYKEHFTKDAQILVIVRRLGNARWFTEELFPEVS